MTSRLSNLPDGLRSHILSLMPTKFAVQTSILSKRWRYDWMFVTNLNFDDITNLNFDDIPPIIGLSRLEKFVDRVLEYCKTSQIESCRLNFSSSRIQKSSVSKWIDRAVLLNVRKLHIHVILLGFPLSLFTCKTLTELRIGCGNPFHNDWECPSVVNLPCLKTLDLTVFTNSFGNALKLICGCPMLENLSLDVAWHNDGKDFIFNIPTLKRLKLTLQYSSYDIKVFLHVPNLEYLYLGGRLYPLFVMEHMSSLVEAFFSFGETPFNDLWVQLLKGVSGVKLLSLQKANRYKLEASSLSKILSTSPLPIFPNMKHLELKGVWDFGLIREFLESSPELKYLCIGKLQGARWTGQKLLPACMLTKLTTIKFLNFKGRKSDVPFVKFMLRNAVVLKTVTITLENSSIEETQLRPQLLKLPRASGSCAIHFHRD